MHPHTNNPFDTRPPGNPDTAKFLAALGDKQAAEAYRQAMGEEARPSTTDDQEPQLTTDELARLQAAEAALRDTQEKKDLAALSKPTTSPGRRSSVLEAATHKRGSPTPSPSTPTARSRWMET